MSTVSPLNSLDPQFHLTPVLTRITYHPARHKPAGLSRTAASAGALAERLRRSRQKGILPFRKRLSLPFIYSGVAAAIARRAS
jgi:hypothetical protein